MPSPGKLLTALSELSTGIPRACRPSAGTGQSRTSGHFDRIRERRWEAEATSDADAVAEAAGTARGNLNSATGLRLSWFVYRGAGKVTFDPSQIEVWEDYTDGTNSPWSSGWKTPPAPPEESGSAAPRSASLAHTFSDASRTTEVS
jgi:hypothetical protein